MDHALLAALLVALSLAAVLLTSGVAKLRDRVATRDAFDALRVPEVVPREAAAIALPWLELALGVLLLAAPRPWLVPVAVGVLVLMLAYTAVIARALGFDEPVTCSCFGSIGRHDVDRTTLVRNLLLTVLAAALLWSALAGGSTPGAVAGLDASGWWAVAAAVAAAAVAVLVAGGPSAAGPGSAPDDELLDYDRQPIPYGVVATRDGRTATLRELAMTQARLVVVLSPGCGPCVRTAERLDDWAARLSPAVGVLAVYPDVSSAATQAQHAADLSLSEPDLNVRRLFSVGTPAAVLLGADGFLAGGPVFGEDVIAEFVDDVLAALAEQPDPADQPSS